MFRKPLEPEPLGTFFVPWPGTGTASAGIRTANSYILSTRKFAQSRDEAPTRHPEEPIRTSVRASHTLHPYAHHIMTVPPLHSFTMRTLIRFIRLQNSDSSRTRTSNLPSSRNPLSSSDETRNKLQPHPNDPITRPPPSPSIGRNDKQSSKTTRPTLTTWIDTNHTDHTRIAISRLCAQK